MDAAERLPLSAGIRCAGVRQAARQTLERESLRPVHCSGAAFSGDDIILPASTDLFTAEGRIYRQRVKVNIADSGSIAENGSSIAAADGAGNMFLSGDFGPAWSC